MSQVGDYIRNPSKFFCFLAFHGFFKNMGDREYIQHMYHGMTGLKLDLDHPKSFNEKMNWLKLNDHQERYTQMVDKIEAKKYIANILGNESVVPVYKVWDHVRDIDVNDLPDQFVLKTNHDSGGYVICDDKSRLDLVVAKKKLSKSFNRNYYYVAREWPYKNVQKKIFAEK